MGKTNNQGRASARRGRAPKIPGLDVYINNMFRADSNGVPKKYESYGIMRGTQDVIATDILEVLPDVINGMLEDGRDAAMEFAESFEQLEQDLIDATPWHEDGPTDPPFHAAEVWKTSFEPNGKSGFTLKLYNPKDYMPFLEAGWSPQAPAGWIAGLWAAFMARLR